MFSFSLLFSFSCFLFVLRLSLHDGLQIFSVINQRPQQTHGTDFSRIRPAVLDGHARRLRQTIVSGAFHDAAVNQFVRKHCGGGGGQGGDRSNNVYGHVKLEAWFDSTRDEGVRERERVSQ